MPRLILPGAGALAALLAIGVAAQAAPTLAGIAPPPPRPVAALHLVHGGHGGAVQASGTVNAVDPARHTVNLSHGPIRALGRPAMTMDFPVSPDVDLAAVKPGMRVSFTLVRGDGGMVVDMIQPAGGEQ